MKNRPWFCAVFPPANPTTDSTAGSFITMARYCRILLLIDWKEVSCEAITPPMMRPVSCCGKNPLGTMM